MKIALGRVRRQKIKNGGRGVSHAIVARKGCVRGGLVRVLLKGVGHCAGIAVEFDEITSLRMLLQLQCVDEGLRVDGFVGDGVALESGRERGRVGCYCGRHS